MNSKKYQIFISSTYEDLIEHRLKVRDTVLSMMHFPVGMELFGAADEKQWEIIKETIDSSDYYVLIIGNRYGSIIEESNDCNSMGISYTEKEFDYACKKNIPILAFLSDKSVKLDPEKIEDDEHREKLVRFREKIKKGKTVDFWSDKDDLAIKVSTALHKQIKRVQRPGWVRGTDQIIGDENIHEKELERVSFVFEEYCLYFEDQFPTFSPMPFYNGVSQFVTAVANGLANERSSLNNKKIIASGVIASILRIAYSLDKYEGKLGNQILATLENQLIHLENDVSISIHTLLSLVQVESFLDLSSLSKKAFARRGIEKHERSAIAFAVFTIYFTDLFLILSRYPKEHEEMIRYKTNADVCRSLSNFSEHVSFQNVPVKVGTSKHRIDICLSCSEANAHKAAALFVNEFERSLEGFEGIFSCLEIYLYYVRAQFNSFGQDNVASYNFEAYTPTLMPLLSGGHLYSTNLVFIRELVQNAIDSIFVRKLTQGMGIDVGVSIDLSVDATSGQINSLVVKDNGMGMSRIEIERYLTSIGRSYYTASDFTELHLPYSPISSFGIGFLSCFLVCQRIEIETRSVTTGDACLLSIPNIEGCFFIEEDQDLPYGTRIQMEMNKASMVRIYELLEYAWMHFLDINCEIVFSWDGDAMVIMKPVDENKNQFRIVNTDLVQYAHQETQASPCPFSFVDDGVLLPEKQASIFRHRWWNQYVKNQYGGIELVVDRRLSNSLTVPAHAMRRIGEKFFLFFRFRKMVRLRSAFLKQSRIRLHTIMGYS